MQAVVISAYKDLNYLQRLINFFQDEFKVFVHIDQKVLSILKILVLIQMFQYIKNIKLIGEVINIFWLFYFVYEKL